MTEPMALAELATLRGIGVEYLDFRDRPREVPDRSRAAILRAMGVDVDSPRAVAAAIDEARRLQLAAAGARDAQPGEVGDGPERCFEPDDLASGGRRWGVSVQLYTLRSASNWGIGDFGDLVELVHRAAAAGADFVGLNPLHALFAGDPAHSSPYSASSRHALNVLYIAVEQAPGFEGCAEARAAVADPGFQQELTRLRNTACVDYDGVARAKLPVLRSVHEHFLREHVEARSAEGLEFEAFVAGRGETLRLHALFEAIDEVMRARREAAGGWLSWPAAYRDPRGRVVAAFERSAAGRVGFHAWLQWVADRQLAAAAAAAREAGMGIGLYGDYAVGVNAGGSEVWSRQHVYRLGAGVGAPPDALALKGQDWGIPPMDPLALMAEDFRPFAELMRDNMRHFGALRLDHVMSLYRLWWVPRGLSATDGGYVHYPLDELLAALARASRDCRCLVIGEDLGTVPREMSLAMKAHGVYHYKVLMFEKEADGAFTPPGEWSRGAIAAVTTHDLPTLASWWAGSDIELRARLGLYPDEATRLAVEQERQRDREHLLEALAEAGLRPRWPVDRFEPQFAAAIHSFLGASRSALVAVQAEDLLGMLEPVNVPGTSTEHPNWLRKLSGDLAELFDGASAQPILEVMRRQRPRG
jgi:4-alpha-glucanotransferase